MSSFLFSFRMADLIQFFPAVAAIAKEKDKFKVLVVRRFQTYEQLVETVDVLFPALDFWSFQFVVHGRICHTF